MNKNIFFLTFLLISCSENKTVPLNMPFDNNDFISSEDNEKLANNNSTATLEAPNEFYKHTKLSWSEKINISYQLQAASKSNIEMIEITNKERKVERYLRYKSLNYLVKKMSNKAIATNDKYDIGDENAIILPEISEQDYLKLIKSFENKDNNSTKHSSYHMSFKLKSSGEDLSNIKLKSYFLDPTVNSLKRISNNTVMRYEDQVETKILSDQDRTYSLREDGISTKELYSRLSKNHRIVYKIQNYDLGNQSFAKLHLNNFDKFARVIISTPESDRVIYAKKGESLASVLSSAYASIDISTNGNIKTIGKLDSEIFDEDYFSDSLLKEMNELNGWFHFEKNIDSPLKAGTDHFVVYTTWEESLRSVGHKNQARKIEGTRELNITNLKGHENIYLNLTAKNYYPKLRIEILKELTCFVMHNFQKKWRRFPKRCDIHIRHFNGHKLDFVKASSFFNQAYIKINGEKLGFEYLKKIGALEIISEANSQSLIKISLKKLELNTNQLSIGITKWQKSENLKMGNFHKKYLQGLGSNQRAHEGFANFTPWGTHERVNWYKELKGFMWVN